LGEIVCPRFGYFEYKVPDREVEMNWVGLVGLAAAAGMAAGAENPGGGVNAPPVLRRLEPEDSVVLRLPGPTPATPAIKKIVPIAPVPTSSPLPKQLVLSLPPVSPVPATGNAPKTTLPAEAGQDLAFYSQKQIGKWREADLRKLLGAPLRSRPAYDEKQAANGKIYAYRDPSGHYREIEFDFDAAGGTLRTVFVYPPSLTWQQAQRRWKGEVSAADAQQGRKFYSYVRRRMDVLVDAQGNVISLGLY
jgi:hypothetical protein